MERRKFRYCRVSREGQSIERQIRSGYKKHSDIIVITEVHSRTTFQGRKEWEKLMKIVRKGDLISFDSVSRMCGSVEEGCSTYERLYNLGVDLEFDREPYINTEAFKQALQNRIEIELSTGNEATDALINTIIEALNKYTIELAKQQIKIAFEQSEKEVQDLRQRTREGIETARLNGKQIGQKRGAKLTTKKSVEMKDKIRKMSKFFEGNLNDGEVISILGLARNSFYKYKREILLEMERRKLEEGGIY